MIFIKFFMLALATLFVGGVVIVKWYRNRKTSELNEALRLSLEGLQAPPAKAKREWLAGANISFKRPLLGEEEPPQLLELKPEEAAAYRSQLQAALAKTKVTWSTFGLAAAGYLEAVQQVDGTSRRLAIHQVPQEGSSSTASVVIDQLEAAALAESTAAAKLRQLLERACPSAAAFYEAFNGLTHLLNTLTRLQANTILPGDFFALSEQGRELQKVAIAAFDIAARIHSRSPEVLALFNNKQAQIACETKATSPESDAGLNDVMLAFTEEARAKQLSAITAYFAAVESAKNLRQLLSQMKEVSSSQAQLPAKPESAAVDTLFQQLTANQARSFEVARGIKQAEASWQQQLQAAKNTVAALFFRPAFVERNDQVCAAISICDHLRPQLEQRLNLLSRSADESAKEAGEIPSVSDAVDQKLRRGDETNFIAALRAQSKTLLMALSANQAAEQKSLLAERAASIAEIQIDGSAIADEQAINQTMRLLHDWSCKKVKADSQLLRARQEAGQRMEQLRAAFGRLQKTCAGIEASGLEEARTDELLIAHAVARAVCAMAEPIVDADRIARHRQEREIAQERERQRSYHWD